MTHKNVQNYYNEKCAKYLMFDLKSTEELSFMTLKGDAKLEEKLTCGQVDSPELPETPEITEMRENFTKVTKYLTKFKEKSHVKKQ